MRDASQSSEFWDEGGLESCFVAQYPNYRYSLGVDEDIPNVHATSSVKHSPSNIKDVYLLPLTKDTKTHEYSLESLSNLLSNDIHF